MLRACVNMYKHLCMWLHSRGSVWLNEVPDGDPGQAHVGLRGPAEVDGVAVQTDVLQCVPDVVEIFQVAECVPVHHLNVVTLQDKMVDEISSLSRGDLLMEKGEIRMEPAGSFSKLGQEWSHSSHFSIHFMIDMVARSEKMA